MKKFIIITSLLIFICNSINAQVDIYIKVVDANNMVIQGESVAMSHLNDINANDAGQTNGVCMPGQNCGIVTGDFIYNMFLNKAVNPLRRVMYLGTLLKSVDVVFAQTTPNPGFEFYKIHMENVAVTNIAENTTAGMDRSEIQISFKPQKFRWTYTPTSGNGNPGPSVQFGWDRVTNTYY